MVDGLDGHDGRGSPETCAFTGDSSPSPDCAESAFGGVCIEESGAASHCGCITDDECPVGVRCTTARVCGEGPAHECLDIDTLADECASSREGLRCIEQTGGPNYCGCGSDADCSDSVCQADRRCG